MIDELREMMQEKAEHLRSLLVFNLPFDTEFPNEIRALET
jgi:hypothetical protein